jgi:hypothetical protein
MLEPFLFDSHRDVTNALFEVYYDLSNQYVAKCYDPKKKPISKQAEEKVVSKHGL